MDEQVDGQQAGKRTGRARVRHAQDDDEQSTTAQLRDEMPSARTIGRSSARDPAAAPMDTDDEAAGSRPPEAAIEHEMEHERTALRRDAPGDSAPGGADNTPDAAGRAQGWATIAVVLILLLGCVALLFAMR